MKSKAPLTLMELLIMVLIFALAAALCLQAFVQAELWSRERERKDQAVVAVQNTAELVKYYKGDLEAAAERSGGHWDGQRMEIPMEEDGKPVASKDLGVYDIVVELHETQQDLLGSAVVTAVDHQGEELFSLTVGWQEVSAHE